MGYRDDFYSATNIIGYTGQLHMYPTVYFRTRTEYGHITQEHDYSQNVGRMTVLDATGYEIGNELVAGQLRLVEKMNGAIFHESRSTLTTVGAYEFRTLAKLAKSIQKYPNEKYITTFSPADRQKINQTANQMGAVAIEIARNRIV